MLRLLMVLLKHLELVSARPKERLRKRKRRRVKKKKSKMLLRCRWGLEDHPVLMLGEIGGKGRGKRKRGKRENLHRLLLLPRLL